MSSAKHNTNPFIVSLSRFSELGHEPADEIVSRAVVSPRSLFAALGNLTVTAGGILE
ncbi:MAG: hypothetical protein WBD73_17300 [Candidatus Acidiferrales bacterium]